jgi:hypothetical protein
MTTRLLSWFLVFLGRVALFANLAGLGGFDAALMGAFFASGFGLLAAGLISASDGQATQQGNGADDSG